MKQLFWNLKNAQEQSGHSGDLASTGLVGLGADAGRPATMSNEELMSSGLPAAAVK